MTSLHRRKCGKWLRCAPAALAAASLAGVAHADEFNVPAGSFTADSSWADNSAPGFADEANINNGGTATLTTGSSVLIDELHLGQAAGQTGTLVMQAGSTLTLGSGNGGDDVFAVGDFGTGTFTMNGGLIDQPSGDFHIGKNGFGSVMTMNGGEVNLRATLRIARGQSA